MKKTNHADREPAMAVQIEELDDAIEECIQRFSNETTGTGVKVLIAEFEELMLLKTKLLTQMVIADQQVKHICKRFGYEPKPKMVFPEFRAKEVLLGDMYQNKVDENITAPPTKKDETIKSLFISAIAVVISIVALIIKIFGLL